MQTRFWQRILHRETWRRGEAGMKPMGAQTVIALVVFLPGTVETSPVLRWRKDQRRVEFGRIGDARPGIEIVSEVSA